jgi:tRNASer (uridine44-2'-O)-methyltransferase
VATFLMLLWRDMYPPVPAEDREGDQPTVGEEWDAWGRPPGGFVDLGCVSMVLLGGLSVLGRY